jgi:hypothetical protein
MEHLANMPWWERWIAGPLAVLVCLAVCLLVAYVIGLVMWRAFAG